MGNQKTDNSCSLPAGLAQSDWKCELVLRIESNHNTTKLISNSEEGMKISKERRSGKQISKLSKNDEKPTKY